MQHLEPLEKTQIDPATSKVLKKFVSKLSETLTECQALIYKCQSTGLLSASFRSLTQKASYTNRFNRLEKKSERMTLPASLVNMVSVNSYLFIVFFAKSKYNTNPETFC